MVGVRLTLGCCSSAVEDEVRSDMGEASTWAASSAMSDLRSGLVLAGIVDAGVAVLWNLLSCTELARNNGVLDCVLSTGRGALSLADCATGWRDIPGRPRLPDTKLSLAVSSS